MSQPAHPSQAPAASSAAQPSGTAPGVFVPQHVIAATVSVLLGIGVGVLVWLAPAVWQPVGAGIAVTGLALALYALWHGRHRA